MAEPVYLLGTVLCFVCILYMWHTSLSTSPSRVASHISGAQLNTSFILWFLCTVSRSCTPFHIQECSNDITFPKMCIALFMPTNYMQKNLRHIYFLLHKAVKKEENIHINKSVYSWLKTKKLLQNSYSGHIPTSWVLSNTTFRKQEASIFTLHVTIERDAASEMLCLK
jgi:hypothetical protein